MSGKVQEAPVDLALVLAVDVSGSISNERLTMQIEGYAEAIVSPAFAHAVAGLANGHLALTYLAWSSASTQIPIVPWRAIVGAASAAEFASALRAAPRPGLGFTSISGALDRAASELAAFAGRAGRRVIDISGDGINNDGRPVAAARDAAVAAGITINGLPIVEIDPNLDAYFRAEVIGGAGAFLVVARDASSLAQAIQRKLITEIADRAAPPASPA